MYFIHTFTISKKRERITIICSLSSIQINLNSSHSNIKKWHGYQLKYMVVKQKQFTSLFFFKRMFQNTYNSAKTTTQKYSVLTNYSVCMMFLTIWNAKSLGLCLGSFSFVKWLSKLRNGASVCLIYQTVKWQGLFPALFQHRRGFARRLRCSDNILWTLSKHPTPLSLLIC